MTTVNKLLSNEIEFPILLVAKAKPGDSLAATVHKIKMPLRSFGEVKVAISGQEIVFCLFWSSICWLVK